MKVKVINNNRFSVGIDFANEASRQVNIKPNSFALLEEDDILYIDSVSRLISGGTLLVENQDTNEKMGYVEKNPNTISEDEIVAILKMPAKKMKEELEKLTSKHAIDKVIAIAKEQDLQTSKLKVIKEVFGIDVFEEIDKEIV